MDMMPWIHVSGMSLRITGRLGFSRRIASLKSLSRPKRTFTPGSLRFASSISRLTSFGEGGPWLSPVITMASHVAWGQFAGGVSPVP